MKRFSTSLLLCCFLWLLMHVAAGQTTTTALIGIVHSVDNQILAKASVEVVYEPSGTRRTAKVDNTGNFTINELPVGGPYTVQVSKANYQPEVIQGVFLLAGQTANGTFVLHPAEKSTPAKKAKSRPDAAALPTSSAEAAMGAAGPARYHLTYIKQCRIVPTASSPAARPAMAEPVASAAPVGSGSPAGSSRRPAQQMTSGNSSGASGPVLAGRPAAGAAYASTAPAAASRNGGAGMRPAYVPRPATRVAPPAASGHYDAKSGNYIYDTGAPISLALPQGKKLVSVGKNSTESQLYRFITDPGQRVDTVNLSNGWLSFDRVYFESGRATLTKESMPQLQNIAALMKAYPNLRLKLGGYTDSVGAYKMNRQLSEARARTAWSALVDMGVSPARLDARGYGSNYPVASNQTEEGRAMNRRLSVKVLQK